MKNVNRTRTPNSLQDNATRWTQELLEKIEEFEATATEFPKSYYEKYRKSDIKQALEKMYKGLCCYCEASIGQVDYPHIEHRKPKQRFPENTYEWANLHLACTKCNVAKGTKFNDDDPILDAVRDDPVSIHLTYKLRETGVWCNPITSRGRTTICHTDLNREDLRRARGGLLLRILDVIKEINDDRQAPAAETSIHHLRVMSKNEYGSLIEYALDGFLRC